jgi:hypothetical protein
MAGIGEKLSEAEVGEMVREMDADGDGNISYDEFVMWINADLSAAVTSKGDGDAGAKHMGDGDVAKHEVERLNFHLEKNGLRKLVNMRTAQVSRWHMIRTSKGRSALIKAAKKFRDKCRGFVEFGFSSATPDKHVALDYSGAAHCKGKGECDGWRGDDCEFCSKHRATVLEISTGQIDRGASLKWVSQFPAENEVSLLS